MIISSNVLLRMCRTPMTGKEREEDIFCPHWGFNPEFYVHQAETCEGMDQLHQQIR